MIENNSKCKNTLLLGSAGTGKTLGHIRDSITHETESSIVITDVEGVLQKITEKELRQNGYKIVTETCESHMLSKIDIDECIINMMRREKIALFIIVPSFGTKSPALTNFYAQLFNLLSKRNNQSGNHIKCFMDEFSSLNIIPSFLKTLSVARVYNYSCLITAKGIDDGIDIFF